MLKRYSISLMVHWWSFLGACRTHLRDKEDPPRAETNARGDQPVPKVLKEMNLEELKTAYGDAGFAYRGFFNGAGRGIEVLVQRGTELFSIETSTRTSEDIAVIEALNFIVNNAVILGNDRALERFRYEM